jgi:hypothetical protein
VTPRSRSAAASRAAIEAPVEPAPAPVPTPAEAAKPEKPAKAPKTAKAPKAAKPEPPAPVAPPPSAPFPFGLALAVLAGVALLIAVVVAFMRRRSAREDEPFSVIPPEEADELLAPRRDEISPAEILAAGDHEGMLEKRLDEELRARLELEQRFTQANEELRSARSPAGSSADARSRAEFGRGDTRAGPRQTSSARSAAPSAPQ